jgi:Ice-binding-like
MNNHRIHECGTLSVRRESVESRQLKHGSFRMLRRYVSVLSGAGLAVLCVSPTAWAQVAPPLGTAAAFAVLGHSAVTGAAGAGVVVSGEVGSSPTPTVSNFPPPSTAAPFTVHFANDGVVQAAHTDAIAAYNALLIQGPGTVIDDDLSTVGVLTPGIYSFTAGAPDLPVGVTLTLNDPIGTGIFIFNVASSLTANVTSSVAGTANPCNILLAGRLIRDAQWRQLPGNRDRGRGHHGGV